MNDSQDKFNNVSTNSYAPQYITEELYNHAIKLISKCPQSVNSSSINNVAINKVLHYLLKFQKLYLNPQFGTHRLISVSYILITLYSFLTILGCILNVAMIFALLKHKSLKNITNIYIFCLALSDIVICSFNVPLQLLYDMFESTRLTNVKCRLLFTSFGIPIYASCLIILLIAIDRYQMIVYPLSNRITPKIAICLVICVLIFSITSSLPVAIYSKSDTVETFKLLHSFNPNTQSYPQYCIETWPKRYLRLIYSISIFLFLFLLPLIITFAVYLRIYNFLNTKRTFKKRETERKKKTNTVLSLVVIMFGICWFPWCFYSLLLEIRGYLYETKVGKTDSWMNFICHRIFDRHNLNKTKPIYSDNQNNFNENDSSSSLIDNGFLKLLDMILKLIAMASTIVNPFLYGWLNEPIRIQMLKIFSPLCCHRCSCLNEIDQENGGINRQRAFGLTIIRKKNKAISKRINIDDDEEDDDETKVLNKTHSGRKKKLNLDEVNTDNNGEIFNNNPDNSRNEMLNDTEIIVNEWTEDDNL